MKVLHGTWIPFAEADFIQKGAFYLWVETPPKKRRSTSSYIHPGHLAKTEMEAFLMTKLHDKSQLEPISDPPKLQGTLREYQKRGVSWLQYLENLGLNGCLADDMGLGKSAQVIARLVNEKESADSVLPTLLIAPTSVVGNWVREIAKFAPHLQAIVHHGSNRIQQVSDFEAVSLKHDVVITSFTLARKGKPPHP